MDTLLLLLRHCLFAFCSLRAFGGFRNGAPRKGGDILRASMFRAPCFVGRPPTSPHRSFARPLARSSARIDGAQTRYRADSANSSRWGPIAAQNRGDPQPRFGRGSPREAAEIKGCASCYNKRRANDNSRRAARAMGGINHGCVLHLNWHFSRQPSRAWPSWPRLLPRAS